ncbi:Uncharacterised protein [Vibrio cholerae]|nr:Uncharacterised protein [Vibrio cholerae]
MGAQSKYRSHCQAKSGRTRFRSTGKNSRIGYG